MYIYSYIQLIMSYSYVMKSAAVILIRQQTAQAVCLDRHILQAILSGAAGLNGA